MDKKAAFQALHRGENIRHYTFTTFSHIYLHDGKIHNSNGKKCSWNEFWDSRKGKDFDTGYQIVT